jgi:hypothetical protein
MEGAAIGVTFSEVFTVVEDTRVGVEVPTRVPIHQGPRIHNKALHKVPTLTLALKVPVTEETRILGILVPVDMASMATVIDLPIIPIVPTEAIQEVIHMAGTAGTVVMVVEDQAQEAGTEVTAHVVDIQTKEITPREVLTMATREAEEEADEVITNVRLQQKAT